MPRQYKNSPIIEAVFEARFDPSSSWDAAIPGMLYDRLHDGFPNRRSTRSLDLKISGASELQQQVLVEADKLQFLSEDEIRFVQVGPHVISAHHLRPYTGWINFQPQAIGAIQAYREIASPNSIHRLGLRYINEIRIPTDLPRLGLSDYFGIYPYLDPNLPQDLSAFLVGIQTTFESDRDVLRLQLTNGAPGPSGEPPPFILDIDYSLQTPGSLGFDDVPQWLEIAHQRVEDAFEGSIQPRLRELFEPNGEPNGEP